MITRLIDNATCKIFCKTMLSYNCLIQSPSKHLIKNNQSYTDSKQEKNMILSHILSEGVTGQHIWTFEHKTICFCIWMLNIKCYSKNSPSHKSYQHRYLGYPFGLWGPCCWLHMELWSNRWRSWYPRRYQLQENPQ